MFPPGSNSRWSSPAKAGDPVSTGPSVARGGPAFPGHGVESGGQFLLLRHTFAGHDDESGVLFLLLRKHFARLAERVDASRDARIDRHVNEDLADLLLGQPVGERAAHMQL